MRKLLLSFALLSIVTAWANAWAGETGSISGKVTESATGTGLRGIYVTASPDISNGTPHFVHGGMTDDSGAYAITGLEAGSYRVRFAAEGHIEQWYDNRPDSSSATPVVIATGGSAGGINAVLAKGGSISGRVTDGISGAAVPSVQVTAYDGETGRVGHGSETDATGAYVITGLASGNYKIRIAGASSGYVSQWQNGAPDMGSAPLVNVTAPAATPGVDAALVKGGSIAGRVTDGSTGAGITSVYVSAYDSVSGEWTNSASADANGDYTIIGLATGEYRVYFDGYSPGYQSQWHDGKNERGCADLVAVTAPAATSGVNASLGKALPAVGGSISGRVTDADSGAGIQGVSISITRRSTTNAPIFDVYGGPGTDANGTYTISGLSSGDYTVSFSGAGYITQNYDRKTDSSSATPVTVTAPGATTGIDAALIKGGGISGRVTDGAGGAGIGGVWVYAYESVSGGWTDGTSTEVDGSYALDGLSTGNYKVQFEAANAGYLGRWYDDKQAMAEATTVAVHAPSVTSGVDSRLDKGGSISGKLTDSATGAPLPLIRVHAFDMVNENPVAYASTDSAGAYTLKGLSSGNYKVQFSRPYLSRWYPDSTDADGATVVTVAAPAAITGIDMALTKGGSIAGTIIVASCPAPGSFWVIAYDISDGMEAGRAWVDTEYSRNFTIDGLPTGSYKLYVDTGGTGFIRVWYNDKTSMASADTVTVNAPATTTGIEFHLLPGGSIAGKATDSSGNPVFSVTVEAFNPISGALVASTLTDFSGDYVLRGLPAGSYKLRFSGRFSFADQWYKSRADLPEPSVLTLSASEAVNGIDVVLQKLSLQPFPIISQPAPHPVLIGSPLVLDGDLNRDGKVDIADALRALQLAVGIFNQTVIDLVYGDVAPLGDDGKPAPDGKIDVGDALVIMKKVLGLVS